MEPLYLSGRSRENHWEAPDTIKAEFDFGEFNTWESRYNTPDPASVAFEISKAAPPAEDKPDDSDEPDDSDKPDNSDKPGQSGSQSSSSGRDKSSGSGATRQDPVKGRTNSTIGILTGTANSTANDGKSHWMQDEHGWWLRFADSSYPKGRKTRYKWHCICMGAGKRQLVGVR